MHYVISVLVFCLAVAAGFMQHYKSAAERNDAELAEVRTAHAQNMAMLDSYKLQAAALSAQLNELNELAQSRQAQLDEVLNHEQNQTWASQRVPDDINRLFESRNHAAQSAVDLPANHRMPRDHNKDAH